MDPSTVLIYKLGKKGAGEGEARHESLHRAGAGCLLIRMNVLWSCSLITFSQPSTVGRVHTHTHTVILLQGRTTCRNSILLCSLSVFLFSVLHCPRHALFYFFFLAKLMDSLTRFGGGGKLKMREREKAGKRLQGSFSAASVVNTDGEGVVPNG